MKTQSDGDGMSESCPSPQPGSEPGESMISSPSIPWAEDMHMRALKHAKKLFDENLYNRAQYENAVQRADARMEQFLKNCGVFSGRQKRGQALRPSDTW